LSHTEGASRSSHVFLLFGSVFAPIVLCFKVHVIKNRFLFSLSSINSFPRIFPPTTPMPSYSHRLDALIAGASSTKAGSILRKVEKTSATPAGYQQETPLLCSNMFPVGGFLCATSPTYVAQHCAAQLRNGGQDTEHVSKGAVQRGAPKRLGENSFQ